MEPMPLSFHGIIHYSRLKDRLATNVVPFAEFVRDAAAGTLPDFSLIEPNFISGHGDYHPAFGRSLGVTVDASTLDPPSSVLGGEAFLARIFTSYRSSTAESGSNVWNTALLIGWDEPGGTYDHVPPGPVPPLPPVLSPDLPPNPPPDPPPDLSLDLPPNPPPDLSPGPPPSGVLPVTSPAPPSPASRPCSPER